MEFVAGRSRAAVRSAETTRIRALMNLVIEQFQGSLSLDAIEYQQPVVGRSLRGCRKLALARVGEFADVTPSPVAWVMNVFICCHWFAVAMVCRPSRIGKVRLVDAALDIALSGNKTWATAVGSQWP